jgi:peptide chain release factor 2
VSKRYGGIFDLPSKKLRLQDLEAQSALPEFWEDQKMAQKSLKEKGGLERFVRDWDGLAEQRDDVATLIELAEELDDDDTAQEARDALAILEKAVSALETRRLLSGEHDQLDAIVEINAGAGGTDAADWADMLVRMYGRWADREGFSVEILDRQVAEEAGIRSATFAIRGPYAYGFM